MGSALLDRRCAEQAACQDGIRFQKPNGFTVLRIRDVPKLLWDKPCDYLFGIGSKTAEKLLKLNIRTIGQLAGTDETMLVKHFGVIGSWMKAAAHGIDHSTRSCRPGTQQVDRAYDNAA